MKNETFRKVKARVSIQTISPKRAGLYLEELHVKQRAQRAKCIDRMADEMIKKQWYLSPDAILLICGKLANGQHRMQAVVKSGTTQQFLVMETEEEDLFPIVDVGLRRTVGDICGIHSNANTVAAVANIVIGYNNRTIKPTNLPRVPRYDQVEFLKNGNVEHINRVMQEIRPSHIAGGMVLPLSAAISFLIIHAEHSLAKAFLKVLLTGDRESAREDLGGWSASDTLLGNAMNLRGKFIDSLRSSKKIHPATKFYLLFRFFSSSLNAKAISTASVALGDGFPFTNGMLD